MAALLLFKCLFLLFTTNTYGENRVCNVSDKNCFFERYSQLKLPRIDPVKVGHVQIVELEANKTFIMKTLALRPPIFEIEQFLSGDECDHIIKLATKQGLEMSSTMRESIEIDVKNLGHNTKEEFNEWDRNKDKLVDIWEVQKSLEVLVDFTTDYETIMRMFMDTNLDRNGDGKLDLEEFLIRNATAMAEFIHQIKHNQPHTKGRHSQQTWLKDDKSNDTVMLRIQNRVQRLTRLPMELIQASEYLQVVNYGPKGHYNCHLDSDFTTPNLECCHLVGVDTSNCRVCRYLTVLYFLNDVEEGGETAFPLADNSTFDEMTWIRDDQGLCNLAKNCQSSNVVAKPSKGKAIMWYNHHVDKTTHWMGILDHFSFHGGCDVIKGRKWIANNWIGVSNNREQDIWNWIDLAQSNDQESNATVSSKEKDEL